MVYWFMEQCDRIIVTAHEFVFGKADHLLLNLDRTVNNSPENVRAQLLYSPETIKFEDFNKREARDWKISINCIWQETDSLIIELKNKTLWKCSRSKLDWQIGASLEFDLEDERCTLINLRNSEKVNATIANSYSKDINLPIIQKIYSSATLVKQTSD